MAHDSVACRRYANHLCDFSNRAWQCSLCGRLNDYTSLHNRRCAAVDSCMSIMSSCLYTLCMNGSLQQESGPVGVVVGSLDTQLHKSMRCCMHTVSWWPARDAFAGGELQHSVRAQICGQGGQGGLLRAPGGCGGFPLP